MRTLISLINHRNISTLVATKALRPRKIYLLHAGTDEDRRDLETFARFFGNLYTKIELVDREMDFYDCEAIRRDLKKIVAEEGDVTLDLSNGNPVAVMLIREGSQDMKIPVFVFSERDEKAVLLKNGECTPVEIEKIELKVQNFVESGGGSVFGKSTDVFESVPVKKLLKWQISHHTRWMEMNDILKRKSVLKAVEDDLKNNLVIATLDHLSETQQQRILEYIYLLQEYRIAKMKKERQSRYSLDFRSEKLKRYVMSSGFWLEAIAYHGLKYLEILDDLESGVSFFWDDQKQKLSNEIDVVGVYREKLVVVSCKDTPRYMEKDLYELAASADALGGSSSIRLLISTFWPDRQIIRDRAAKLKINLIRYEGDVDAFGSALRACFPAKE